MAASCKSHSHGPISPRMQIEINAWSSIATLQFHTLVYLFFVHFEEMLKVNMLTAPIGMPESCLMYVFWYHLGYMGWILELLQWNQFIHRRWRLFWPDDSQRLQDINDEDVDNYCQCNLNFTPQQYYHWCHNSGFILPPLAGSAGSR